MKKKTIINIAFCFFVALSLVFLLFKFKGWSIDSLLKGKMSVNNIAKFETVKEYSPNEVASYMHKLANGLIIAEDNEIWGVEEITKDSLSSALTMALSLPNCEQKAKWINIIKTWQKADFSRIVDNHNEIWDYLDGGVGRASKVNIAAVRKAEKTLKK